MTKNRREYIKLGRAVLAQECKDSFHYFLKSFWDVINAESFKDNWHIGYLCEELQSISYYIVNRLPKPYDLLINISPGTTKSTIVTIMFPAWIWTIDPTIRIITNSYSSDLSIEHSVKSKDIIESDKYRALFPDIELRRDKSGKQHYENINSGFRFATSTGSTVTGYHAHVIINDDPQNPKQAGSEALRLQSVEHLKTLSSRKIEKANTPTITIMQRLHESDVAGHLLSLGEERIKHICLPAKLSPMVKPIELRDKYVDGYMDADRLGDKVLRDAFIELGSLDYSGQYEQNPIVMGGNLVKATWFEKVSQQDFDYIYKRDGKPPIHFFVDTAYTEQQKNDPTGMISVVELHNKLYIINGVKVRKEFPELITFLPEWVKANRYDYRSTVRIEPKANGLSVIQQLNRETKLNITNTPTPSDSKETRLRANSSVVESGRVVLVDGAWNEEFIDEVCGFPSKAHDEYVDLLNYSIAYFINDAVVPVDEQQLINDFL